ncbi:glycoside hydrolase family 5 protein [Deinococcus altitudinis]|uniref:glycoside hydrolase family 5 protein n=1 Tax=Deinococcus altitudinis TaxID=468914 RepID=UPI0038926E87
MSARIQRGWLTAAVGLLALFGLVYGYMGTHSGARAPLLTAGGRTESPTFTVRRGVNLEGWLDQPQFSGLDSAQLAQLPRVRAAGFDFVRLLVNPVALLDSRGQGPGSTEMAAGVRQVLAAARQADLKVLVSFYTDDAHQKAAVLEDGQAQETYLALLEQTARLLAPSGPQWVAFEPITEAADCGISASNWMGLQSKFVRAARRGDPALTLMISGACYSDYDSLTDLRPLNDPNILYSFLYVEPLLFTQQGNPENPDWASFRNVPYPFGAEQLSPVLRSVLASVPDPDRRAAVRQAFHDLSQADFSRGTLRGQIARAGQWASRHSVTVVLSAFAVRVSAPSKDRGRWFSDVRQAAEANRMPWAVWSWTSPFGFEVSENGVLQPQIKAALGLP